MGEMGSFFDTAHDEAEWDARFGGGARQSGFAGAGDDLAMDFLGASSARRGGRATTRDDLNLPDQAMEDLLGRIAGDRLPEGGGLDPFDARDSQALPEEAPDERGLPPLPLDESDEDEDAPYRPDDTDAEAGTGTGTGTASGALNVTHSSVAPSPAMLELEAAARARAGKAVRPAPRGQAAPGHCEAPHADRRRGDAPGWRRVPHVAQGRQRHARARRTPLFRNRPRLETDVHRRTPRGGLADTRRLFRDALHGRPPRRRSVPGRRARRRGVRRSEGALPRALRGEARALAHVRPRARARASRTRTARATRRRRWRSRRRRWRWRRSARWRSSATASAAGSSST